MAVMTSKTVSPFAGFYDAPFPHDYFKFLEPVRYRAPDETMAVLRPWLAMRGEQKTRIVDFFSGYGANGMLLRTGYSMTELYANLEHGPLKDQDMAVHKAFFDQAPLGPEKLDLTALDIAQNALAYSRDNGVYQRVFDDDLTGNDPSAGLAQAAFEADIFIESGGHHEISAPIIDRLLKASDPQKKPPVILSIIRDTDEKPALKVLESHGYRHRILKKNYFLRYYTDEAEREKRHGLQRDLGYPVDGPFGDFLRYATLYWAEPT